MVWIIGMWIAVVLILLSEASQPSKHMDEPVDKPEEGWEQRRRIGMEYVRQSEERRRRAAGGVR